MQNSQLLFLFEARLCFSGLRYVFGHLKILYDAKLSFIGSLSDGGSINVRLKAASY